MFSVRLDFLLNILKVIWVRMFQWNENFVLSIQCSPELLSNPRKVVDRVLERPICKRESMEEIHI